MFNEQFNQLRDFAQWVHVTLNKAANIDVSIWRHTSSDEETTEYSIWVDGLIRKRSSDLNELVGMIPKLKDYCCLSMEFEA